MTTATPGPILQVENLEKHFPSSAACCGAGRRR
jgi:hypothetical protein